jgi:hypothetical protein
LRPTSRKSELAEKNAATGLGVKRVEAHYARWPIAPELARLLEAAPGRPWRSI